jgi:lipopolysaccharide cholinephosphotransferase
MDFKQDIEQIQNIEIGILKEFIRICDSNNIKYFLAEGSLLGAIRHQGMIPWDDDIDVAMFREDYERFIKIAPGEIQAPYSISDFRIEEKYIDYITQMKDSEHQVCSSYRKKNDVVNVWIDIFVIDGMPKGKIRHFTHKYNLLFHKLLMMWSDLDHYLVKGRKNRPLYEIILIKICQIFHFEKIIHTYKALESMDRCMRNVKIAKDGNVINFMSEYKWRTEFPASYYGEGREVPFEDMLVRIPDESEKILESTYGDYMKLPPESERYKHSLKLL